jgi:hypothetical protein
MNQDLIKAINQEVYRRFPDFSGVRPKVQSQRAAKADAKPGEAGFLLTYQTSVEVQGSKRLPRWVRVVVSPQGKIQKITTSR